MAMENSDFGEVSRDQHRLAGCMALRLDPDFDTTYFHLINQDLLPDGPSIDTLSLLFEGPNAENCDEEILIGLGLASTILGVGMHVVISQTFPEKGRMQLAHNGKNRGITLSSLEAYLKYRMAVRDDGHSPKM